MTFETGMKLFREGNIPAATEQFHQAVEEDENNHKAWNALGICLSKSGQYEDAETCFENALMLDPGNATYEKNRDKNDAKRPVNWQVKPKQEVKSEPKVNRTEPKYENSEYTRNWLQVPLYFVPMVLCAVNIGVGFLAVILCAYYIKRDADSINAGANPEGSGWGKLKGWEWMLLFIFFWILMPVYSWKREQIYEENIEYGSRSYVLPAAGLPLGKIALGIFAVFFLIFILIFAAGMMGSMSSSGVSASSPAISATDIMSKAQAVPYEELARYPEKYKGQPVIIRGQVSQVIDSFGGVNLRVFSKQSDFSETAWFENDVFVDYRSPKERILEKDVITFYGLADGIQDYTTVLGAQRSIPKIKAITHTR